MQSRSKHGILNIVLYIEKSLLYIIDNFPLISQSDILRIKKLKNVYDQFQSTFKFHFFRNACTKSGSLRFSQFSGC